MIATTKWTVTGRALAGLAILGLGAAPLTASAVVIEGALTFSGDFVPTGGAGTDLSDATGLDFIGDDFDVDGASGDFADAGISQGDIGFIQDFEFDDLNTAPIDPLWSIGGFSFALEEIAVNFQNSMFLVLVGRGEISRAGYSNTPGVWTLTANTAPGAQSILFNFSAGTGAIPEPGSMLLVGLGLAGLAAARRRNGKTA